VRRYAIEQRLLQMRKEDEQRRREVSSDIENRATGDIKK
jgi:hypothetical protein